MGEINLLTVVTITRDDAVGLRKTIESTIALRARKDVRHIVVSGDSGDGPEGLDSSIYLVRQGARGIADAFNKGVSQAQGDWIWFLNSGDTMDCRLNLDSLLYLLGNSQADVIIGCLTYEGMGTPTAHLPPQRRWPSLEPWIPHPATLVRRRLFHSHGGFDERYTIAMDYEWWLRALQPNVSVDIVSVPFAVFAPGGVSQRPELRDQVAAECDDIIRRHQLILWRNWFSAGHRLFRAWRRAIFARRMRGTTNHV